MMDPSSVYFWYGESFARRGFVVLAVDISHRPLVDSTPLYNNVPDGDDPGNGNHAHPAIKTTGFDSDWEEDGERAWDAMRALDYLLTVPNVDPKRILVTGLSMGGEMATIIGGLEPRLAMSIPAGFSPDLGVMLYHGNHPCWQWRHADIREYVDASDFYALTAPRPLVIQTGKVDPTFSSFAPPFAADKQVARRARAAYGGESGRLAHYLHYDEHHFHAGDVNPSPPHGVEMGVRIPVVIEPTPAGSLGWQSNPSTVTKYPNLFDAITALVP